MSQRSFPRQLQHRRMLRAATIGATGLAACTLTVAAARFGATAIAAVLTLIAVTLLIDARRWWRLAGRSRIGAESEDEVRHALAALEADGWRLRHSLAYGGRGDIDSVAIAPTGIGFARSRRGRLSVVISPRCGRWRCGFTGAGGGGVAAARSRCCASCAHGRWSGSMMGCWSCRWSGSWGRFAPRLGQRGVRGSSLGTSRAADGGRGVAFPAGPARGREFASGCGDVAGRGVWSGGWVLAGFVGEDADDEEVCDAVGDRLGRAWGVAVERADGERREPAGLLGMLDQRWCLARR